MTGARPEWAALSDQEVVLRARSGQEAAYRELIRRYERPVFALLFRMVRDREPVSYTHLTLPTICSV